MGDIAPELDNVHPALRPCFHPVCRSADVARGQRSSRVRLLGEDWAVARIDGALVALADRCPHRWRAAERRLRRRRLASQCAYHGYRFGADGRCVAHPGARRRVADPAQGRTSAPRTPSTSATGSSGWRPSEPLAGDHRRAGVGRPGVRRRPAARPGVARRRRPDGRQLPRPRPPPVHSTSGRSAIPTTSRCPPYTVERDGLAFICDYVHSTKLLADSMGAERLRGRAAPLDVVVRRAVRASACASSTRPTTSCSRSCSSTSRSTRRTTKLYCFDLRNDIADGRTTVEDTVAFQLAVAEEDRALLERIVSKAMPLDLQAEVHTRADRITLEMRRVLLDLVRRRGGPA